MGGVTVMAGGSIPHKQRLRADDRLASVVTGCPATRRTFRLRQGLAAQLSDLPVGGRPGRSQG